MPASWLVRTTRHNFGLTQPLLGSALIRHSSSMSLFCGYTRTALSARVVCRKHLGVSLSGTRTAASLKDYSRHLVFRLSYDHRKVWSQVSTDTIACHQHGTRAHIKASLRTQFQHTVGASRQDHRKAACTQCKSPKTCELLPLEDHGRGTLKASPSPLPPPPPPPHLFSPFSPSHSPPSTTLSSSHAPS